MRHGFERVELSLDAGGQQLAVHPHRARQVRSRVPEDEKVGGNPVRSANTGDRYGSVRSWLLA
jgi:hypothetical protein